MFDAGKETKLITPSDQEALEHDADSHIDALGAKYPAARLIDILNAYLASFTKRTGRPRDG